MVIPCCTGNWETTYFLLRTVLYQTQSGSLSKGDVKMKIWWGINSVFYISSLKSDFETWKQNEWMSQYIVTIQQLLSQPNYINVWLIMLYLFPQGHVNPSWPRSKTTPNKMLCWFCYSHHFHYIWWSINACGKQAEKGCFGKMQNCGIEKRARELAHFGKIQEPKWAL